MIFFYLKSISSACVCAGVYERMRVDQRKFGKSSWTAAVERMERLRYSVAKETLQLQRAREICLDQRKHTLREQVWQRAPRETLVHERRFLLTSSCLALSDAESV